MLSLSKQAANCPHTLNIPAALQKRLAAGPANQVQAGQAIERRPTMDDQRLAHQLTDAWQ
jgi:hypothetical protein